MELRVVFILATLGIVQCKMLDTCNYTKIFVNGHNNRRLRLANGEVSGHPAASKMTFLIWDKELAEKANKWASKKIYGHNPDRTIPSGRFGVGENIYWYGTSVMDFNFNPESAMDAWWNEYKDFKYHPLSKDDFNGSKQIGHYTQMAWADSIRLGCAISQYNANNMNNFYVVCNYGPTGNYLGQNVYPSGNGASHRLECGEAECTRKYGDC